MKSGVSGGGVRQYVTVERPIGTSKPAQIDRKFVVIPYLPGDYDTFFQRLMVV